MIAHGTVLLLHAPVTGDVLSVLLGHLRRRVARLTILIPARPDMARLPVYPAEVVISVAGVVDHCHFQHVDRPAVVLYIRKCQQLHVDEPIIIRDQGFIKVPEVRIFVIAAEGARLQLQLHQLSLV